MLVIDPMHCLYLGVAKHILQCVWIAKLQSGSENKLLIMRYWEQGMLSLGRSSNSSSVLVISITGFTGEELDSLIVTSLKEGYKIINTFEVKDAIKCAPRD